MPSTGLPRLLVVDDELDARSLENDLRERCDVRIRHPEEINPDELAWADAVLVDLRLTRWPERDGVESVSRRPIDGVCVATSIRKYCERELDQEGPHLFAVRTGHIEDLSEFQPPDSRPHLVAGREGLDWAFGKSVGGRPENEPEAILNFTLAAAELGRDIEGSPTEIARELFRLDGGEPWHDRSILDAVTSHLPIRALERRFGRGLFARWLLHRVLPYPAFLVDIHWLAVRTRIEPKALSEALEVRTTLSEEWSSFEYKGVVSRFLGRRWWRAGFDAWASKATTGNQSSPAAVLEAINALGGAPLENSVVQEPVFAVDAKWQPINRLCGLEECTPLQPADWPFYADPVWILSSELAGPEEVETVTRTRAIPVDEGIDGTE